MNTRSAILATAATIASFAAASASVISVNFRESAGHANQLLAPSTVAGGGAGVAVSNWNTVAGGSGSAAAGVLVDDSGTTVPGTAITWSSGGTWGDGTADAAASSGVGNAQLMRGYLDDNQPGAAPLPIVINVASIPYTYYDVVVYFSTDTPGGIYGEISATGSNGAKTGSTTGTKDLWGPSTSGTPPVDWPGNPTFDDTNSLRITAMQGDLTINVPVRSGTTRHSVAGFQIIESVPEPSTFTLAGLAALALAGRRRRA